VMLLFLRPFRVLEKIVITGITGTVQEIGLFRTVLVTDDGLFVSVPNSNIFSGVIINASRPPTRRTGFSVDIDRDADIECAKRTMLDAISTDEHVLRNPAPRVVVDQLSGSQVVLTLQAWVSNRDFTLIQSDLRLKVRRALSEAGFSPPIPVPAPAVAPWSPPAEKAEEKKSSRPN